MSGRLHGVTNERIMNEAFLKQMLLLGLLSSFVYYLLRRYWKQKDLYKDINKLRGPPALPFFGSAHLFLRSKSNSGYIEVIDRLIQEYTPPMKIWLGPYLCYITMDPEELEIILRHPAAIQKPSQYKIFEKAFGQGIFVAPDSVWKKNRRLIEPIFNQATLNNFVGTIVEKGTEFMDELKKKTGRGFFDIYPLVNNCALSIILEFAIGMNKKDVDKTIDYGKLVSRVSEIIYTRVFKPAYQFDVVYRWTALCREEKELSSKVHNFTDMVIRKRNEELKVKAKIEENTKETKGKKARAVLLDVLLEKSESANYTMKQIRNELVTFVVAGYDTIAFVMSITFIMLAMFPQTQDKVYAEIMDIIGPERIVEHSDLSKLKYLEMVIRETMRLFPITPFFGRHLQDNITLKRRTLPKGLNVFVPLTHMHRSEKFWPEPLEFKPERFTPEECAKRHSYTWLPFSAGPRNCIGMRFALMEMKVIIAMTVRDFTIKTNYATIQDIRLEPNVINTVIDGCNCSIERRNKSNSTK